MASHRGAASLWSLPGFDAPPVEVTAVRHLRRHAVGVVWHESRRLDDSDVTVFGSIPVTLAGRTLIDLGSVVDSQMLQAALDDALRRNLVTAASVYAMAERLGPRRRGSGNRQLLRCGVWTTAGLQGACLNRGSTQLVRAACLPPPERQYVVRDQRGEFIARIDFVYPMHQLAIEIDSVRHHAGVDDWRRDLARQNQLLALGWRILRFTADDLKRRSEWVIRMVRSALEPGMRI